MFCGNLPKKGAVAPNTLAPDGLAYLSPGVSPVGQLYDLKVRIEEKIKADGLDSMEMKGKLGLRSGKLLSLISPTTPDNPETIAKLKLAAKELLKVNL